MTDRPLFSVVLATYNRGPHIRPTIQSVLWQTCSDFELIVVGDGCTDETEQAVTSFRDARVTWRNLAGNSGSQSAPNNEGIRCARGAWICYVGHDDIWSPDHLARLRALIQSDEALDFAVSGCVYYGPAGSDVYFVTGMFEGDDAPLREFFPPSSIAHRAIVTERIGEWRDPLSAQAAVDADFLLRAARGGLRFGTTGRVTVHKFAASHRYLSYLRQSSAEQTAMLVALEQDEPAWIDHIIAVSKQHFGSLGILHPDVSARENGWAFHHNRKNKGLNRPALEPLERPVVIEQTDEPRGLDWHALERGTRPYRWSGPSPRPGILIPYAGREAWAVLSIENAPPGSQLDDVSVFVEERKVEQAVSLRTGGGFWLAFPVPLKRGDYTVVTLHTPTMFRPDETLGWNDHRKLGLAISDIILTPR